MICYKDMTFCGYYKSCRKGKDCFRSLTDEVKQTAIEEELYICKYAEFPNCYEKTDK